MTLIPSLIFLLERTMAGCLCTACPIDILLTPAPHALNLHPPTPSFACFYYPTPMRRSISSSCAQKQNFSHTHTQKPLSQKPDKMTPSCLLFFFFNVQLLESLINNANSTVVALIQSIRWRHESRLPLCCTIRSENRRARLHEDLTW